MIKTKVTTKTEIQASGTLMGIDDSGFLIESEGMNEVLSFDVILGMFQGKEFKVGLVEVVKDETEITE
jgi:hypothetical protein